MHKDVNLLLTYLKLIQIDSISRALNEPEEEGNKVYLG